MRQSLFEGFIVISIIAVVLATMPKESNAEVYVLYDTITLEVKSAINKDDAIVEPEWTKVVLPGKLKDYGLTKHPRYYKFINGDFVQDNDKISKEANDKEKGENYSEGLLLIKKRLLRDMCDTMEVEGTIFKEVKCSDFN